MITNYKTKPFTGNRRNYMSTSGYTKKCGTPTDYMVQLEHSNRWYRVMLFCVSNTGTYFIKTKDNPFMVVDIDDIS